MTEETLSDKRKEVWEDMDDIDEHGTFHYPEEDVKDFIKKLKEALSNDDKERMKKYTYEDQMIYAKDIFPIIDKLAGDDLK